MTSSTEGERFSGAYCLRCNLDVTGENWDTHEASPEHQSAPTVSTARAHEVMREALARLSDLNRIPDSLSISADDKCFEPWCRHERAQHEANVLYGGMCYGCDAWNDFQLRAVHEFLERSRS